MNILKLKEITLKKNSRILVRLRIDITYYNLLVQRYQYLNINLEFDLKIYVKLAHNGCSNGKLLSIFSNALD